MTWARRITESREAREERLQSPREPSHIAPLRRGCYAPVSEAVTAAPKSEPYRDQALRDLAEGRPCMLIVPGVCNARVDTTVLCHENQGKGMGLKQSDERAVWGCVACHEWFDRSGAPREQKRAQFMAAHSRQALAYRVVATDGSEPERFRRAALRALARLNASPVGDVE